MTNMSTLLLCLALLNFAACQETPRVYIGTGVNGIAENTSSTNNNEMIILGGLFSIYENPGINPRSIHRMEAVALAIEKVNQDPSLLPGITLGFEIRATGGDVNMALEESIKYVSSRSLTIGNSSSTILGISGVIGAGFSSVSTSVARLLRLFQIPQISYASTADVLSNKDTFDYFLRTVPPDSYQAQALADMVELFNWTYVIAMHTNDVYGSGGTTAFVDELERRNSTQRCIATPVSISLPRESTAAEEFQNALEEDIAKDWINNATVIVLFATRNTAIGLLTAVKRKREMDPEFAARNLTWIGSDGWGANIPSELRDTVLGSLSVAPQSFSNDEFERHFLSLNPRTHQANPWFEPYWEEVFNCSLGQRTGYEECDLNSQSFSLESTSLQTSTVTPAMDAVYAFAHAIHNLQRDFCGGGPGLCQAILTNRSGGVAIRGELLLNYLHNVSFSPGFSTEVVAFDDNGDPKGSSYAVSNLQRTPYGNLSFEMVGEWDGSLETRLKIAEELIQWNEGSGEVPTSICSLPCSDGEYPQSIAGQAECCWVCRPCQGAREYSDGRRCQTCERGYMPNERKTGCVLIPVTFLTWTHAWTIVTAILTCVGIIATITVAIIFIVYRNHRIVKASSRELSAVLLTGILLCYLLPLFYAARPAPWVCGVRRFSIGFCFAICYSALLVKTNRIHRIFNREITSTEGPPLINPLSQLFLTALLVSVQVIIAVIWLIVEAPSVAFIYSDFSTELICGESTLIELAISLAYSFLLLIVTTYYGFRTRNVPQNFNEAKFISFTMYTLCVLWLAFIPIYFAATARLGVVYQSGSLMLAIILNASITLCCLFVPKIYFLFSTVHKDHTTQGSQLDTVISMQRNLNSSAVELEPRKLSLPNVPAIKVPLLAATMLEKSTQTD